MIRTSEKFLGVEWIDADRFIRIDETNCTGCANCIKVCVPGCYEIQNKKAVLKNLDYCLECGACWFVCTNDAIDFSWPKGGTGFRTNLG